MGPHARLVYVGDLERAAAFYRGLFGWRIAPAPEKHGWALLDPDGHGPCRLPTRDGAVVYYRVPSVRHTLTAIRSLGGGVLVDRTPIRGRGSFAVGLDTEGNPIGLWSDEPCPRRPTA